MSTRCVIEFAWKDTPVAYIYRHSDGYPDSEHGVPADLCRFLLEVDTTLADKRFGDPEYLAAKFVVWQAAQFGSGLDFLSLGITTGVEEKHEDINYVYRVSSQEGRGMPLIKWRAAGQKKWHKVSYAKTRNKGMTVGIDKEKIKLPPYKEENKYV